MTHIAASNAPTFELPGVVFTGLASPSRGARETCAWRVTIAPGTPGSTHQLDREEVFVVTAGSAVATVAGQDVTLSTGDGLVVDAGTDLALANPGTLPFEAVVILPVGAKATMGDDPPFTPPWTE